MYFTFPLKVCWVFSSSSLCKARKMNAVELFERNELHPNRFLSLRNKSYISSHLSTYIKECGRFSIELVSFFIIDHASRDGDIYSFIYEKVKYIFTIKSHYFKLITALVHYTVHGIWSLAHHIHTNIILFVFNLNSFLCLIQSK